ncbi:PREDICTED: elongation of very long chain fatty acids protein 6-like [Pseudopodoces humilis]|uniref:elongation of very long chain fatty acids protein 6-like n=1 Tax=Pseudopodoces humilis TaxID=181119 RepID=UPI0003957657|nr:PREDICTED: elongation of very long chain fatty acids protein 6-like [Pseudopodoces humilis]
MLNMEANVDPSELQPLGEYDFEKNFNHLAARKWMEENWQKSFIFAVIYFILIFGIQHFMKERRPFNLRAPLILWSFSLTLFSLIAACRVWKQVAFLLLTKGFKQSVCSQSFYIHPVSKLWMYLFALSKLVEMGDTLFIVLRKKKLMFVHWYHHLLTMIMSWYGYKIMAIGMGWNAALNLSIHSVMYLYYTVTAMGFRVPRSITMLITTSQMVQMTGFVIMNIFIVFWMDDKLCRGCVSPAGGSAAPRSPPLGGAAARAEGAAGRDGPDPRCRRHRALNGAWGRN